MGMHNKEGRFDEQERAYIQNVAAHNDEAFSFFLARELTQIRARVLEVAKAPMNAFRIFPVQTEIAPGAATAIQRVYDSTGMAKVIANYADDLPRADAIGKEIVSKVVTVGDSYGYNTMEIEHAQFAGVNLSMYKAQAARRAIDLKINKMAWFGDADNGVTGFINNPNLTSVTLAADGTGSSTKFTDKTPDQIIRDITKLITAINVATNNVENPNMVLLPTEAFDHIVMTPRSQYSDLTILEFLRRSHPDVRFEKVGELDGAGTAGADLMIAGRFDPDVVRLEIPERFRQLPVEKRNLEYVVDCIARVIGVTVTIPMAFSKASGC